MEIDGDGERRKVVEYGPHSLSINQKKIGRFASRDCRMRFNNQPSQSAPSERFLRIRGGGVEASCSNGTTTKLKSISTMTAMGMGGDRSYESITDKLSSPSSDEPYLVSP